MTGEVIRPERWQRAGGYCHGGKTPASRVPRLSMSDAEYERIVRLVDEAAARLNNAARHGTPRPFGRKLRLVE